MSSKDAQKRFKMYNFKDRKESIDNLSDIYKCQSKKYQSNHLI